MTIWRRTFSWFSRRRITFWIPIALTFFSLSLWLTLNLGEKRLEILKLRDLFVRGDARITLVNEINYEQAISVADVTPEEFWEKSKSAYLRIKRSSWPISKGLREIKLDEKELKRYKEGKIFLWHKIYSILPRYAETEINQSIKSIKEGNVIGLVSQNELTFFRVSSGVIEQYRVLLPAGLSWFESIKSIELRKEQKSIVVEYGPVILWQVAQWLVWFATVIVALPTIRHTVQFFRRIKI